MKELNSMKELIEYKENNPAIIVNVSHNTDYLSFLIEEQLQPLIMEYNDNATREKATEIIKNYLNNNLKFNIRAICNEWNNAPEIIDNNQLVVDVNIEFSEK